MGRADIEGSKSAVDLDSYAPQASYPCGNFSGTSNLKFSRIKGSLSYFFKVRNHTEIQNQASFYLYILRFVSVKTELTLSQVCYCFTLVPPQSNSPAASVFCKIHPILLPHIPRRKKRKENKASILENYSFPTPKKKERRNTPSLPPWDVKEIISLQNK